MRDEAGLIAQFGVAMQWDLYDTVNQQVWYESMLSLYMFPVNTKGLIFGISCPQFLLDQSQPGENSAEWFVGRLGEFQSQWGGHSVESPWEVESAPSMPFHLTFELDPGERLITRGTWVRAGATFVDLAE